MSFEITFYASSVNQIGHAGRPAGFAKNLEAVLTNPSLRHSQTTASQVEHCAYERNTPESKLESRAQPDSGY